MACTEEMMAWLAEARTALHRLTTGAQVVSVDVEGHRVTYTQASRADLARYVRDLEAQCETTAVVRRRPVTFVG